jgi:hypothetical protein
LKYIRKLCIVSLFLKILHIGGKDMSDFSFFNLGFRSENVCDTLERYNKKESINKEVLLDSKKILEDCLNINANYTKNLTHSNYDLSDLIPIIFEIYRNKTVSDIVNAISSIQTTIDILVNETKPAVEVSAPLFFFKELSKICLNRNNSQSIINSI